MVEKSQTLSDLAHMHVSVLGWKVAQRWGVACQAAPGRGVHWVHGELKNYGQSL